MMSGFSFEELCRTPLVDFLEVKTDEDENKFIWYMDFISLPDGGERWGVHESGLARYNALAAFQKLVFDKMAYSYQMIAKRGTDDEWHCFVKENLSG